MKRWGRTLMNSRRLPIAMLLGLMLLASGCATKPAWRARRPTTAWASRATEAQEE